MVAHDWTSVSGEQVQDLGSEYRERQSSQLFHFYGRVGLLFNNILNFWSEKGIKPELSERERWFDFGQGFEA